MGLVVFFAVFAGFNVGLALMKWRTDRADALFSLFMSLFALFLCAVAIGRA